MKNNIIIHHPIEYLPVNTTQMLILGMPNIWRNRKNAAEADCRLNGIKQWMTCDKVTA